MKTRAITCPSGKVRPHHVARDQNCVTEANAEGEMASGNSGSFPQRPQKKAKSGNPEVLGLLSEALIKEP